MVIIMFFAHLVYLFLINTYQIFLGAFITYFSTHTLTIKKYQKEEKTKLESACIKIGFYLAVQMSEYGNLLKQLDDRMIRLEEIEKQIKSDNHPLRDDLVGGFQDFFLVDNLVTHLLKTIDPLLNVANTTKDVIENVQAIYLCEKRFILLTEMLKRFNETKRTPSKIEEQYIHEMLDFAKQNFPHYKNQVESNLSFSTQTFDSFKSLCKDSLKINLNLTVSNKLTLTEPLFNKHG